MIKKTITLFSLLLPAIFAAACDSVKTVDLVADGTVKVDRVDSDLVDLSNPAVERIGDSIQVSGTVTRQPGNDNPIPGHVQILFLTPQGGVLDEIDPIWQPSDIPTDGSRQATYSIDYLWLPPAGTVVRVDYGASFADPGPSSEGPAGKDAHGRAGASAAHSRTGSYHSPGGSGFGNFGR